MKGAVRYLKSLTLLCKIVYISHHFEPTPYSIVPVFGRQLQRWLQLPPDGRRALNYTRIFFYMLNGIISTYKDSRESYEELIARLEDTFANSIDIVMRGLQLQVQEGDGDR